MKKIFPILLLGFVMTWFSCQNEFIPESFLLEQEETFRYGGTYYSGNSLKFKITEVNDSRCPSDVVCVWQGEAKIKIQLESPVKGNMELSTYHQQKDTVGMYAFELVGVSPYPVSTKNIELSEYSITLKISDISEN